MTTIIVTNEDNQVNEFEFEPGKSTITLGRRSTNDVCIPDLSVSGKHATISFKDGEAIIEDLNSTNGSYVNGQVVQRSAIQPDDEIILGKVLLSVVWDKLPAGATATDVVEPTESEQGSERTENNSRVPGFADSESSESYRDSSEIESPQPLHSVPSSGSIPDDNLNAEADTDSDTVAAVRPATTSSSVDRNERQQKERFAEVEHSDHSHPLDGLEHVVVPAVAAVPTPMHELDSPSSSSKGAVIEIRNGAKSGQILPIDKPVTTLGRPGIQIAAIMRKPDGYFLMHIESDDTVDRPTLNSDFVGDEPVLLHSGDELTVAGIDVAFMLS